MLTKVCIVKAMFFPVVMYKWQSLTIKKAENWRTDAFKLWCWRSLKSPLDCKEIKPVNPKGSNWIIIGRTDAEAPIFWPPDVKSWPIDWERSWFWERLGQEKGWQRMRRLDSISDLMEMRLSKLWQILKGREAWHAAVHGVIKNWTWLNDWKTYTLTIHYLNISV